MNDRYLYRAKRTDNGEWVKGFYFCMEHTDKRHAHHFIIPLGVSLEKGTPIEKIQVEVDPSTIFQCTGLKDKNGNLIWENDIVRFQFDNDDCPFPNKDIKKRIGKVFFSDFRASWSIAMGRNGSKCLNNDLFKYVQNGNRVEIIGNIFDNPELLE